MSPAPIKPVIDMAVLDSIDVVRVGRIESVLAIDGSDKLMKLQVNFGDHTRAIVAGIKLERENPRDIEGKQALCVQFDERTQEAACAAEENHADIDAFAALNSRNNADDGVIKRTERVHPVPPLRRLLQTPIG